MPSNASSRKLSGGGGKSWSSSLLIPSSGGEVAELLLELVIVVVVVGGSRSRVDAYVTLSSRTQASSLPSSDVSSAIMSLPRSLRCR